MLAGALNFLDVLALALRHIGLEHQIGHANDGVHRGANFVAHIGQKGAFGAVGTLRNVFGLAQQRRGLALGGDVLDHAQQLLAGTGLFKLADALAYPKAAAVLAHQLMLTLVIFAPQCRFNHGSPHPLMRVVIAVPNARGLAMELTRAVTQHLFEFSVAAHNDAVPHQHNPHAHRIENGALFVMGLLQADLLLDQRLAGLLQASGALLDLSFQVFTLGLQRHLGRVAL